MAARSGFTTVAIIVLLLVALAVFAPILAQKQGITWLPSLTATPKDTHNFARRVWVNRRSGFYYCRKSKFYARIHPGFFMRQGIALERGYRPGEGEMCP
jgi:hypothetical protein